MKMNENADSIRKKGYEQENKVYEDYLQLLDREAQFFPNEAKVVLNRVCIEIIRPTENAFAVTTHFPEEIDYLICLIAGRFNDEQGIIQALLHELAHSKLNHGKISADTRFNDPRKVDLTAKIKRG